MDDLLPPGSDLLPPGADPSPPAETKRSSPWGSPTSQADAMLPPSSDSLLPPGVDEAQETELKAQPLPIDSHLPAPIPKSIEAPANPELAVKEPKKKIITADGEEIELRRLSPEEKARRRFKRNIILVSIAAVIFGVALVVLLRF